MAFINDKGVLTWKSEVETGTSKNGNPWAKQTIVVSREGVNAPYDKVALSVFGARVNDTERCNIGDKVEITYSVSAREYNGRWYNDISLYKIEPQVKAPAQSPAQVSYPANAINEESLEPQPGDLPF